MKSLCVLTGGAIMKKKALGLSSALAIAGFFAFAPAPAFAAPVVTAGGEFCLFGIICIPIGGPNPGGPSRGAPGPIAGAGLPFLALGAGAFWLIKRRRKSA
jgi:hypothetical protein